MVASMRFKVGDKVFLPPTLDEIAGSCYTYEITEVTKSFVNGAVVGHYKVTPADEGCHLNCLASCPVWVLDNYAFLYDSPEAAFWRL